MADSVRVQFSASIGALIKGVEDAKEAINSVRESVDSVTEGGKALLETFGVAFSVDKIVELVEKMAELGEQVERTASILGVTTGEAQQLGLIAKVTGGDAQGLALSIERLQLNLQKAQTGTSQQALALQALGLSAKSLIGLPLDEQLDKIADAVARFGDGGNKTAIVIGLLGRSGAQMIPVLDQGSEGLERLRQASVDTGAVMTSTTIEALSGLEKSLNETKASLTSLSGTLVGLAADPISHFLEGVRETAGNLVAMATAGDLVDYMLQQLDNFANNVAFRIVQLGEALKNLATLNFSGLVDDWAAANERFAVQAKAAMAEQLPALQKAHDAYQDLIQDESDLEEKKPQAPALNVQGKDVLASEITAINAQIAAQDKYYQSQVERINSLATTFQIGEQKKTQMLLAAVAQRHDLQSAEVDQELSLAGLSAQQYQKAVAEKLKIDEKYAADRQKILDQAFQAEVKQWDNLLNPVVSAWDSQLRKLLAGTETFGQAMKNIFADLALSAIKELEKIAVQQAAIGLAKAAGGGPQSLLSGLLGGGQAAAQTANTTALATLTAAVAANTVALGGETAATAAASASGAAAGAGGFLSIFKSLFAFLPAFDVGSWSVPGDMVAQIHQGEAILPNNGIADAFRSGLLGGGGGGNNAVTINGAVGTQQWLNQVVQQFTRVQQQYQARTPSTAW